jgi:hypothetical protein
MYAIRNEDLESDSDSNYEDEDELTRIIPPEGKKEPVSPVHNP